MIFDLNAFLEIFEIFSYKKLEIAKNSQIMKHNVDKAQVDNSYERIAWRNVVRAGGVTETEMVSLEESD